MRPELLLRPRCLSARPIHVECRHAAGAGIGARQPDGRPIAGGYPKMYSHGASRFTMLVSDRYDRSVLPHAARSPPPISIYQQRNDPRFEPAVRRQRVRLLFRSRERGGANAPAARATWACLVRHCRYLSGPQALNTEGLRTNTAVRRDVQRSLMQEGTGGTPYTAQCIQSVYTCGHVRQPRQHGIANGLPATSRREPVGYQHRHRTGNRAVQTACPGGG